MVSQFYLKLFRITYSAEKANLEECLLKLKLAGASQVDSVKVLIIELKLTLSEADTIVFNSKHWQTHKAYTDELRFFLENILENFDDIK